MSERDGLGRHEWGTDEALLRYVETFTGDRLRRMEPGSPAARSDLREWVNQEDSFRRGGYHDRQLLELLQNGVDAARAGKTSRITVRLAGECLYVANQGEALDQGGFEALVALHSSAKRSDQIGRFGLGFKSLLRVSDRVDLFSRTVSLRFDAERSRELFSRRLGEKLDRAPVMRLAWSLDPQSARASDDVLAELMAGHDTVVRVTLRERADAARFAAELEKLRVEFLLFVGKDIVLDCAGQVSRVVNEGDGRVLTQGERATSWRVFSRTVDLSGDEDLLRDRGVHDRLDGLPVLWAVPAEERAAPGAFWSFFPLADGSRVPGILNAPFRTSDDRNHLLDHRFNRLLLDEAAALIVDSLPALRTEADPARHLDYLPRRPGSEGELAAHLAERVWAQAKPRVLAVDATGALCAAADVHDAPGVPGELRTQGELRDRWAALATSDTLRRWSHPRTHLNRDRVGRWNQLIAGKVGDDLGPWVEAVATRDAARAVDVLRWVEQLLGADKQREPVGRSWRVVLDATGALRAGAELLREGGEPAQRLHPELAARDDLREVLAKLGVRAMDEAWHRDAQRKAAAAGDWPTFWTCYRAAPPGARVAPSGVRMLAANGAWIEPAWLIATTADTDVLPAGYRVHASHTAEECAAFAVTEEPRFVVGGARRLREEWSQALAEAWREEHGGRRGKQPAPLLQLELPPVADLFVTGDNAARCWLTLRWQGSLFAKVPFGFQRERRDEAHPIVWAIRYYGVWDDRGTVGYALAWLCADEPALFEFVTGARLASDGLDALRSSFPEGEEAPEESEVESARVLVRCALAGRPDVPPTMTAAARRVGALAPLPRTLVSSSPPVHIAERFPWISTHLREPLDEAPVCDVIYDPAQEESTVWFGDGGMDIETVADQEVSLTDVLEAAQGLGWLVGEASEALDAIRSAEQRRAASVRDGRTTDVERLVRLIDPKLLRARLGAAAGHVSATDAPALARAFLALHGCGALRALREELAPLGAPARWGTSAAREFVRSLGFNERYAIDDPVRRSPFEEIAGPPSMPPLYGFQEDAARALRDVLARPGGRAMLSLPTGAGKTRVAVEALLDLVLRRHDARRLVLWIAQQDELCEQALTTFATLWRHRGTDETLTLSRLWQGNRPVQVDGPQVVVATVASLHNRMNEPAYAWLRQPAVAVIDEAHHGIARTYTEVFDGLGNDWKRHTTTVIGLSATPYRGASEDESRLLSQRFDDHLIPAMDVQVRLEEELIQQEVLARAEHEIIELPTRELTKEEVAHVEQFQELPASVLQRLGEDEDRNERIVRRVEAEGAGAVLLFAATVEHARGLAARLASRGVAAACIDGSTPPQVRRDFIRRFRARELRVLVNCAVLTTGFDDPGVDTVLVARPTFSPVLYRQMIGRGLRGPRSGGTARCRIVTMLDNFVRFRTLPAWKWFEDYWRGAPRGK
jgi:superfamily II DNA or RNA helicase